MAETLTPSNTEGITRWRADTGYDVGVNGDTLAIVQSQQPAEVVEDSVSLDLSSYRMEMERHDPDDPSLLKLSASDRW